MVGGRRRESEEGPHQYQHRIDNSLGQQQMLEIGTGQSEQSRREHEIRREAPREADPCRDAGEEHCCGRLNQRVAHRNGGVAIPALPAQDKPREDGHVVACGDRDVARRTGRTRRHNRLLARDAVDHHVQEGAHDEAEQGAVGDQDP